MKYKVIVYGYPRDEYHVEADRPATAWTAAQALPEFRSLLRQTLVQIVEEPAPCLP